VYTVIVSVRRFTEPTGALLTFKLIAILLLAVKSAVNFIVYCWFSEKFSVTLTCVIRLCYDRCRCRVTSHDSRDVNYCIIGMHTIAVHTAE